MFVKSQRLYLQGGKAEEEKRDEKKRQEEKEEKKREIQKIKIKNNKGSAAMTAERKRPRLEDRVQVFVFGGAHRSAQPFVPLPIRASIQ